MTFTVIFSPSATEDLERLFDFLLDRAATVEDLDMAQSAIEAGQTVVSSQLSRSPYSFRKSGSSSGRTRPLGGAQATCRLPARATLTRAAIQSLTSDSSQPTARAPSSTGFGKAPTLMY